MSKTAARLKGMKKAVDKVQHGNRIQIFIPAGKASVGPPLGPTLGQRNINIASFCKDFNEKTKDLKEGIPLPTKITIKEDRSYSILYHTPPSSFFLKQAAGIERGAMYPGKEVAGKITLKHIYEIALIKSQDPIHECRPLQQVCDMLIGTARAIGIEVVRELDAEEYGAFLENRKIVIDEQLKELQEKKEAKLLRAA